MISLTLLQLRTIPTNKRACAYSRNSISSAIPRSSRPAGRPFISRNSNSVRQRARIARLQIHASQSPNPLGGGNGEGNSSLISDLALPAAGVLALLLIAGPIFGGVTAIFGLPLIVTGVAAAFGVLDTISGVAGTTPVVAAAVVASSTLGILLIPAFLKFGFIALAGYFVANLLFGGGSGSGDKDGDGDVTSGSSSYYDGGSGSKSSSYRGRNEFDARDVTIDVEAETIDD
ncbi:hypothetical protein Ndes2526A_g03739 [Nannochloris sp. 'desiccata']